MNEDQYLAGIAALYRTGHHLLTTGNPRRAASLFRSMVTAAPDDERGWLALGVCHEHVDQPEVAIEVYKSACFVLAAPARCALACSRLLRARGDDDDADLFLERAREHADGELAEALEQEGAAA